MPSPDTPESVAGTAPGTATGTVTGTAPAAHAERTADPATCVWRLADPSLPGRTGALTPPSGSSLAALVEQGVVATVHAAAGELRVTLTADTWELHARPVDAAVRSDLPRVASWPGAPDAPGADAGPDRRPDPDGPARLAELQGLVDRAAGTLVAGHGGRITVESEEGGTVQLRLEGTCDGCPLAGRTLHDVIEPALARALGSTVRVEILDEARTRRSAVAVGLARLRRRPTP